MSSLDQFILSILLTPRQYGKYLIHPCGKVMNTETNKEVRTNFSIRRGGKKEIRITLRIDGKVKNWRLHRLIANCFLGPIDGLDVDHDDRDTTNNHVSNLSIVTKKQNQAHWRAKENEQSNRETKREN